KRYSDQEVRELMAQLGCQTIQEMVGRTDLLEVNDAVEHYKTQGLDLSPILYQPEMPKTVGRYCSRKQDHGLQRSLDYTALFDLCRPALERGEKVETSLVIRNVNRVVGTQVGSEITRRHGVSGLPEDTIR